MNRAAKAMADFALKTDDDGAWACLQARVRDYLDAGRSAPRPLQRALIERMPRVRRRGRKPPSLFERELRRTHASAVAHNMAKGCTQDEALLRAAESPALPGPKSVKTLKRHLDWAKGQEPT